MTGVPEGSLDWATIAGAAAGAAAAGTAEAGCSVAWLAAKLDVETHAAPSATAEIILQNRTNPP